MGAQQVKRGRNVIAVRRSHLMVRVIEYPGNMHHVPTPSVTEEIQTANPEDA